MTDIKRLGTQATSVCPSCVLLRQMAVHHDLGGCVTHRQPAADVSDEEERVMFEVAHHGVAAAQFCGPAVPLVVIADGAVANHGQDKGEDPLLDTVAKTPS